MIILGLITLLCYIWSAFSLIAFIVRFIKSHIL